MYVRRRARIEQTMGHVPAYAEDVDIARLGGEIPPEDVDEIPEAPDVPTPMIEPEPATAGGASIPPAEDTSFGGEDTPEKRSKNERKKNKRARNRRHGRPR